MKHGQQQTMICIEDAPEEAAYLPGSSLALLVDTIRCKVSANTIASGEAEAGWLVIDGNCCGNGIAQLRLIGRLQTSAAISVTITYKGPGNAPVLCTKCDPWRTMCLIDSHAVAVQPSIPFSVQPS